MKQVIGVRLLPMDQRLSLVEAHHRQLEARLKELDRRPYLTPNEQREVSEIKKHKLKAKDEMFALRRGL